MNSHRYRVTVDMMTGAKGEPVTGRSLSFEAANHDDLLAIVDRVCERWPFRADEAASVAIGLKLLGEVALRHRTEPLFAEFWPALREFVEKVKAGPV